MNLKKTKLNNLPNIAGRNRCKLRPRSIFRRKGYGKNATVIPMNFEEFNPRVQVLETVEAEKIRGRYISSFVDQASEWYAEHVAIRVQSDDGWYYRGYLWECLMHGKPVNEDQVYGELKGMSKMLYVFWDISSRWHLKPMEYWKFPRDAVLYLQATALIEGLKYLPEDIYIFDSLFSWSLIFTHETTCDNDRLCYKAIASEENHSI